MKGVCGGGGVKKHHKTRGFANFGQPIPLYQKHRFRDPEKLSKMTKLDRKLTDKHRAREPRNLTHELSHESAHENAHCQKGKSAINLSNLGKFCQIWPRAIYLCLGRLAVPKIIYVRPVGGPENTSNIRENPNINNLTGPPRPSPKPPRRFFCPKIIYGTFSGLTLECTQRCPRKCPRRLRLCPCKTH